MQSRKADWFLLNGIVGGTHCRFLGREHIMLYLCGLMRLEGSRIIVFLYKSSCRPHWIWMRLTGFKALRSHGSWHFATGGLYKQLHWPLGTEMTPRLRMCKMPWALGPSAIQRPVWVNILDTKHDLHLIDFIVQVSRGAVDVFNLCLGLHEGHHL